MLVPWDGIIFSSGMLLGTFFDVKMRRAPNWFTVPFWLVGIGAALFAGGLDGFPDAILGSLVGFGLLFVPFALRLLGGGDIKFATAMGAWLGPSAAFISVLVGFIAGGLICVAILLRDRMLRQDVAVNLKNVLLSQSIVRVEDRNPRLSVPMVAALAVGGLLTYWAGWGIHP